METENLNKKVIHEFWTWFSTNHDHFGENFENEYLLNDLEKRVSNLGNFTWEVGPGLNKKKQLVISPNGDKDMLPHTKEIVSYAPVFPDWEFHYSKQPKQWDFIFNFETEDGKVVEIDASNWRYVLLKYDDGMFEVIIQTKDLVNFVEDDKIMVSEIVLDGIIGEEDRILLFSGIDIVEKFENKYESKSSSIKNLADHFKKLI